MENSTCFCYEECLHPTDYDAAQIKQVIVAAEGKIAEAKKLGKKRHLLWNEKDNGRYY